MMIFKASTIIQVTTQKITTKINLWVKIKIFGGTFQSFFSASNRLRLLQKYDKST